jgi:polyphosphate kinase 2
MQKLIALPVLSGDLLSSVVYGPEAMITVLVLAGSGALVFELPPALGLVAPMILGRCGMELPDYLDLYSLIAWQDERMADDGAYDKALLHLQEELVTMQQWIREEGQRVVIVIEGRDAAGKGGVIKRITEYLNPRWCRIAALPAPSDREEGQWYFQRYIAHLPAGGETVLFDRSWYNRAGVERVMGFCTDEEYHRFLRQCPAFERMLIDDGIILLKYWFSVSDEEQERRFRERVSAPLKRWKLSEMDLEGRNRWVAYSKAKDEMFAHCDLPDSPWYEVEADDKKRARLNCIAHLLSVVPYDARKAPKVKLPPRPPIGDYRRPPRDRYRYVPDYSATIT